MAANTGSTRVSMTPVTNSISASSGRIRNTVSNSSSRNPFSPSLMIRLTWPVWRLRWKPSESPCRCSSALQRRPPPQPLLDRPVERPAQLVEEAREPLQADIGEEDGDRGSHRGVAVGEAVDGPREQQRDQRVDQRREGQEGHRQPEPQPEARLAARPDEPPQAGQGLTVECGRSGGAAQGVEVAGHAPDLRR